MDLTAKSGGVGYNHTSARPPTRTGGWRDPARVLGAAPCLPPPRGLLGFNGLVVTDASMMGMTSAMPRRELVPSAIAAGCDMLLFLDNDAGDFGLMLDGYRNGTNSHAG